MYVITFILTLLFIIILLLYVFPLKIFFTYSSEQQSDLNIMMSWLNPLFKVLVKNNNGKLFYTVYIFNNETFTKQFKGNHSNFSEKINKIRSLKPEHVDIQASYGFEDPSVTGLVCGTLDLMSQQRYLDNINNNPNFSSIESYFNINAEAEVNVLLSLISLLKIRETHLNMHPLHGNK